MHHRVRSTCIALAGALLLAAVLAGGAAASSGRATLSGSSPHWAKPSAFKSPADTSQRITFHVYLSWRNAVSAEALARAVSDPTSPLYGRYLTPAQFHQRFSPPATDVAEVVAWLKRAGFSILEVPENNLYVSVAGTVAQAQTAFAVRLNDYKVEGQTLHASASPLTVPASLAGVVSGVVGLDGRRVRPGVIADNAPPPAGYRNAQPWSLFWGQTLATDLPLAYGQPAPYAVKGYTPKQLQGAYGIASAIKSGNDGRGVTVAVIDAYAAPTILADANRYASDNGVPPFRRGQFKQVLDPGLVSQPTQDDESGWYGEETLDVEAVHSMAPGANVIYFGALNSEDDSMDATLNTVIDHRMARIVSNSYGDLGEDLPADMIKAENAMYVQAACEGIGLYFSSGDNGDEFDTLLYRSPDWPASSPWVTGVGGTSLGVGSANQYLFETGWGTSRSVLSEDGLSWTPEEPGDWWYGGGGGTSTLFAQPWYQKGAVPTAIADYYDTGSSWRAVPDVALDGDPTTGMLIGETQTFSDGVYYDVYRVGGTSLSCPLFAGMMALADQRASFPHGFANPVLYRIAGRHVYRDIVDPATPVAAVRADFVNGENADDGVAFSLRSMNQTETLHTIPGYDDVTGLGTPKGAVFLSALGSR